MSKAVTVRLDEADHAALARQADRLRVRPGTLARMLVHAGLSDDAAAAPDAQGRRAALHRMVARSQKQPAADAVALVCEARDALDAER